MNVRQYTTLAGVMTTIAALSLLVLPIDQGQRSTLDGVWGGGGSYRPATVGDVVRFSDAAAIVTVVRVHEARPNTTTGQLPAVDPAMGDEQWSLVGPVTDIEIRIDEVLGQRVDSPLDLFVGVTQTVQVGGGTIGFTLTALEAEILGVSPDAAERPAADGAQEFAADLVPMEITVRPSVELTEGDQAIVFLRVDPKPILIVNEASGTATSELKYQDRVVFTFRGSGVFVIDGESGTAKSTMIPVDLTSGSETPARYPIERVRAAASAVGAETDSRLTMDVLVCMEVDRESLSIAEAFELCQKAF